MARPALFSASAEHHPDKQETGGVSGFTQGKANHAGGGGGGVGQPSSLAAATAATTATVIPRWTLSRDGLSNSVSVPSGVGLTYPERPISTSPEKAHRSRTGVDSRGRWRDDTSRSGNQAKSIRAIRSDSLESPPSQARGQTTSSLRRSSSGASEWFSTVESCSHGGVKSVGGSVVASTDPEVLKAEIRRLQAALMNEFKGGNRFVGGAQFKASNSSRNGHSCGAGGNSCGGCLQVWVCVRA